MDELEIMRAQLEAMKQRLDSQQIVNQSLMRKIMRRKASWLNIYVNAEIISIPILFGAIAVACNLFNMSLWYAWVFLVMCVVDVAVDWRYVRIPPKLFGAASIVGFKEFLRKQKRVRYLSMCVMLPLSLIWVLMFTYSMMIHNPNPYLAAHPEVARAFGIGNGIFGCILGAVVVILIYRKMQRTNDDLLSDIRDLED